MLMISLRVDAPAGAPAQGWKEAVAMALERFGPVHVMSVEEHLPQQLNMFEGQNPAYTPWRR